MGKPIHFKIFGHNAIFYNKDIEVSVPNEDDGTKILMKISDALFSKAINNLKINLPNKTIIIHAIDEEHLSFKAEDNKSIFN